MKFSKITLLAITTLILSTTAALAATVNLPSGTPIYARFAADLNGGAASEGQQITLLVNNDVKVNGKIVIEQNAPITAEIIKAQGKKLAGMPGKIIIAFKSVRTIDGQEILLSGTKSQQGEHHMVQAIGLGIVCCPLFFLIPGGASVIPAGLTTTAYTIQAADIEIAK